MLDFRELATDGQDFELLLRELLFLHGHRVYWSGRGADAGRDLLSVENRASIIAPDTKTWLVQCKHNAHSGKSVGIADLDNIVDSAAQHGAQGYLLACSTYPSSAVVGRLEALNATKKLSAVCWDAVKIEHLLSSPKLWPIAQRFFPKSAEATTWKVYATDNPNHWVANYRGYYFHLFNRIGSFREHHFASVSARVHAFEKLKLPEGHFIRIRGSYYDDKNGGYRWYLDYMRPNGKPAVSSSERIKDALGDGYALEDGQVHFFDVLSHVYLAQSDHYDQDHYDYYRPHIENMRWGGERERCYEIRQEERKARELLDKQANEIRDSSFERLRASFGRLPFLQVCVTDNAEFEAIDRFYILRDWSDLISDDKINIDRMGSALLQLSVPKQEDARFHRLVSRLPQEIGRHFTLVTRHIYVPEDSRCRLVDEPDSTLYELTLSLHPSEIINKWAARISLNMYFDDCAAVIDGFLEEESGSSTSE